MPTVAIALASLHKTPILVATTTPISPYKTSMFAFAYFHESLIHVALTWHVLSLYVSQVVITSER